MSGWTPAVQLVVGAAYLGIGAGFAFDKNTGSSGFHSFEVTESVLMGAPLVAIGLYNLHLYPTTEEARFARYKRDRRARVLGDMQIAQYEGELYSEACIARMQRMYSIWANFGLSAGGAALVALAAGSELRGDARGLTYFEGGALLVVGTASGIARAVTESSNEREWRLYRNDQQSQSRDPAPRLALAPSVGPHSAMIAVTGAL